MVLPPSNQGELQTLLDDLYDPQSPQYHHWLQPGQFLAEFGPSPAGVSAVRSWLHGAGLGSASPSGFTVDVAAPASVVSTALGTPLEQYRSASGNLGYLAEQAPLVPQSLAGGEISAVLGLNTLAQLQPLGDAAPDPTSEGGPSVSADADGLTPCDQAVAEANGEYYTLDQLGAAYGIDSLLGDGQKGSGQTLGLYELAPHSSSDVGAYETCFGLSNAVTTAPVDGGGSVDQGGTDEADLDIEQAATQAPGAAIVSYEGPNTTTGIYDTWKAIVTADAAQVVSTSWGECEADAESDGDLSSLPTLFAQAATQGQTVLAAAGDSGSEGCYAAHPANTTLETDYPASDGEVTAIGGTDLFASDEVAWTDGGGGLSRYVARPTWQPNIAAWTSPYPACGEYCREVPDLSANAGVGMVAYYGGSWEVGGGTSFAAPLVAGLVADRNEGCTESTGWWTQALYTLASEGAYGTALTDITSGDTDVTGSNGGKWQASSGYDLATGLGTPLAAGLSCPEITAIQPATALPGAQVTLSGLGLEHATISFGGTVAEVLSATATSATVVVPTGTGTVTVGASGALGAGTQSSSFTFLSGTAYAALQPYRICDTRAGSSTECSGQGLSPGGTLNVQVTGVTGPQGQSVPADAQSVVLNVTAIDGSAGTFLTVYPAGSAVPNASNLNVPAHLNEANLVVAALGSGGQVSLYNSQGSINVAIDVEGYFAAASGSSPAGLFHPIAPLRICDTRQGRGTECSGASTDNLLGQGQWTGVVVSGCPTGSPSCTASVPTDGTAEAVALNLTAVYGSSFTYLSVVPPNSSDQCPSGTPAFSNLNLNAHNNLPNRVIVPLGPEQDVCVYNSLGSINFILDVNGWFGDGSETSQGAYFFAIPPLRICDTRAGTGTECSGTSLGPGQSRTIPVAGVDGLPTAGGTSPPAAVIANVTAVFGTASTYFTLYPSDVSLPNASDLNVGSAQNTPNLVIVQLATTGANAGAVNLFNDQGSINAIVDVAGWFES